MAQKVLVEESKNRRGGAKCRVERFDCDGLATEAPEEPLRHGDVDGEYKADLHHEREEVPQPFGFFVSYNPEE